MVGKPQSIPPKPISQQQPQAPIEKKETESPGKLQEDDSFQPFPGMPMTKAEKEKFWQIMEKQMGQVIQKQTSEWKKSMEEIKKSIEGED